MTLEDFFTLTEMKDGLTAPSRVQELITVMQKEQDSVDKNAGDATRQWAAVASTISATENKDCLDLFIQLDGLWFINRWLNDAKNFSADANDGFIEESITSMLRAIEKLHLDSKQSISSGIRVTVSNLLGHHSSKVQDKARLLFETWEGCENGNVEPHDMDLDRIDNSSDKFVKEEGQPSAVNEAGNDDGHDSRIVVVEKSPLRSSDNLPPEKLATEQIQNSDNVLQHSVSLDCEYIKKMPNHPYSVLTSFQEVASMSNDVATSVETCNSPVPKPGSFKGEPNDLQLNDLSKEEKQEQIANGSIETLGIPDISVSATMPEPRPVSDGASETRACEFVKQPVLDHNVENNENGDCQKITVSCNVRSPASDKKSGEDDVRGINSSCPQPYSKNDYCSPYVLLDSSFNGRNIGKSEVLGMPFLKTEYVKVLKEGKGQVSNQGSDAPSDSNSFKRRKVPKSPKNVDKSSDIEINYGVVDALEVAHEKGQVSSQGGGASYGFDSLKKRRRPRSPNMIKKNSNIELEYGIDDALAVARQVAWEVERETQSSSSDKISDGGVRQPSSPDSTGKKEETTHVLPEDLSSRQSNSAEASSGEEGHMSYSNNIEAEPECIPDLESSQVIDAARDPGGNSEKSQCNFDLNEEVGSDDMEVSVNAKCAIPIPVVSASKPAQNSMLPTVPLQFEGTLGWKGSAATSAFRPASPWKNSDSRKNGSADATSDLSRKRKDCLEFDLNVAEGYEELVKQIGESPSLPSGQSSVDLSPKRSSRLELDLNIIGDDGDTQTSDHRMEGQLFPLRNGYWSPSPASSSSSMQPSVRNIDLNDMPYFKTDLVEQGPSKCSVMDSHGSSKSDAPMISVLGAKVGVGRSEHVPQALSLPNGKASEPAIDLTMSGAGGILRMAPLASYNNSIVFGYNGLTPTTPLSFSPVMYGSGSTMPYMVDSRGAPVVPQVGGSSSTVLSSYPQSPYVMSLAGAQLSLNGVGPLRPNFDLNSDFMIDGGHRDALAARQFFFPSSGRAMEEQARTIPQSSSSLAGGKRKESESSWEPYPFSYKNPQPPWK